MSKVTIKQSRRFASRALAVFNRNKEASASIQAYEGSLTASAPAVIENSFDAAAAVRGQLTFVGAATLDAVVDHYNTLLTLELTVEEHDDLVQYLLSL